MGFFEKLGKIVKGEEEYIIQPQYTPEYIDADLHVAMPGGPNYVQVPMNFKVKGKRHKNPLDPLPSQLAGASNGDSEDAADNQEPVQDSNNPFKSGDQERPPLAPIALYSNSDELTEGVIPVYPVILESYGVSSEDWVQFIEDLVITAQNIPKMRQATASFYLSGSSYNYNLYKFYTKKYGRMQGPKIKEFVKEWNRLYFKPKGLFILFQEPEEIWEIKGKQEPDYEQPVRKSDWDSMKVDQTKVKTEDKTRILIFSC